MTILEFPPIEYADEHGLLAVGGDLEVDSLLLAYRNGIFPWPFNARTLAWFAPPKRAVMLLSKFHIPRRFRSFIKSNPFECRMDTNFRLVMERCAEVKNRGDQKGTWITKKMINAYEEFFKRGYCHSFEVYLDDELVGGIYGVQIDSFLSAESSFYRVTNASKVAMCYMVEHLKSQGITWFDCQVLTPFSEMFGAEEIEREEFMGMLRVCI